MFGFKDVDIKETVTEAIKSLKQIARCNDPSFIKVHYNSQPMYINIKSISKVMENITLHATEITTVDGDTIRVSESCNDVMDLIKNARTK